VTTEIRERESHADAADKREAAAASSVAQGSAGAAQPLVGAWWSRPSGGREVLAVALPLMVQTGFWSLMWFIDRMYLLWYSQDAVAAALPAGMFFWTMICFPQGIASFVNTFVAQYYGAGRHERIGAAVQHGVWFGWLMTPLFLLAVPLAPLLFHGGAVSSAVIHGEVVYFQTLSLGAGAVVISAAMSSFFTGRGQTKVVMCVDVVGSLVNIVLDWVLIFGKFGLPEMGIAGAGLATAIANWSVVLIYWRLLRRRKNRETYGFAAHRFDPQLIRRLIRFGVPGALPLLVEGLGFSLLIREVAAIGSTESAATALAFNVNAVAFVPLMGLSIAVSTLVGQRLGENRPELAERATWTAISLAFAYTTFFAVLYLGVPRMFLLVHETEVDPVAFAPVRELTVMLLRFVALYCFFDALQITFVGALKGAGDTRFILVAASAVSAAALLVGKTAAAFFDWQATGSALVGWWWVMTGWSCALGVIYLVRFQLGRWKSMRVIEPEFAASEH
jgi:MATE family multidrug resistance protein